METILLRLVCLLLLKGCPLEVIWTYKNLQLHTKVIKVYCAITLQEMIRYLKLLSIFKAFTCKIGNPHMLSRSGVKVAEDCSIISNNIVAIDELFQSAFFLKWWNKTRCLNRHSNLKITFSLQQDLL